MKLKIKHLIAIFLAICAVPIYAQESGAVYIGKNLSKSDISVETIRETDYWFEQGCTSYDIAEILSKEENKLIYSALSQYNVSVGEAYSVVLMPANSNVIECFICVIKSKKKDGTFTYKWYNVGIFTFD